MRAPERTERGQAVSLPSALVAAVESYIAEVAVLLTANAAWLFGLGVLVVLWAVLPLIALVGLIPFALPTAALQRLGVVAARGDSPRWSHVRDELPRHVARKLLLAAGQVTIALLSLTSLELAVRMGGLLGIVAALVAGYVLIASALCALALWPIVCDPRRDGPLADQVRLALAVVLLRPLQLLGFGFITTLALVTSVQLIAPFLFVPSLVLLATAQYVVNVADRLRPLGE
jgi:hypothetical protein